VGLAFRFLRAAYGRYIVARSWLSLRGEASCYPEPLRVTDEPSARTVAVPAVSPGVYGWPLENAARIAVTTGTAYWRTDASAY
jgi:O-acetyl-ADP-ribose deacetylase (regulator of RNase III)